MSKRSQSDPVQLFRIRLRPSKKVPLSVLNHANNNHTVSARKGRYRIDAKKKVQKITGKSSYFT
jgi:hypothetical protein